MAVIKADGLFYGDRLRDCSDLAHVWWPFFYHASNDCGRLEISYDNFSDTALRHFRQKLTREEFYAIIREYQENYLLFLYRVGTSLWGQWIGGEENLPRYKSAASKRSPEPPAEALETFKEKYAKKKSDSQMFEVFVNIAESSAEVREVAKSSESLPKVSLGVGVGVGVGTGDGEVQEKAERVSLSSSIRGDDAVLKIAYEHPKLQHLAKHSKGLPARLERLLFDRIAEDGFDLVFAGTLNLRDAVAKWPPGNDRYVPNPLTFYGEEREYLKDPKEWERPDKSKPGASDGW